MNALRTTTDAKELMKILPVPKKLMKKKFRVIAIPLEEEQPQINEMKRIFSEAKRYKISKKFDLDQIANEVNDNVF